MNMLENIVHRNVLWLKFSIWNFRKVPFQRLYFPQSTVYTVYDQLTNINSILITDWSKNIQNIQNGSWHCVRKDFLIFFLNRPVLLYNWWYDSKLCKIYRDFIFRSELCAWHIWQTHNNENKVTFKVTNKNRVAKTHSINME